MKKKSYIPVGDKIVVRIDPILDINQDEFSTGGILLPTEKKQKIEENMAREEGTVIAMGDTIFGEAYDDFRKVVKVGDTIAFPRYGGKTLGREDNDESKPEYRVMRDIDILCVVKEEESKDE